MLATVANNTFRWWVMLDKVLKKLSESPDFQSQRIEICGLHLELYALSSLVDVSATVLRLKETASADSYTWEQLKLALSAEEAAEAADHVQGILEGRALLVNEAGSRAAWIQPESQNLNRSIDTPNNQNILLSSQTGFIEDIMTNLGLIRSDLRTAHLKQAHVLVGSSHKHRMIVLSLDNAADSALFADCESAIRSHANEDFASVRQVMRWLRQQPLWSPLPGYSRTESPHEAVHYLKQGRIVLLIEGYPEALVIPAHIYDLFISNIDRDLPAALSIMLVFFRVLGALIAIIAPAAYVALVSINPDVMKVELIYSIAKTRVGVPYPSLTEALILLFIIEMLLEAIVRLPKSIGPAMTMVGGIILGQAVVEARLVSNLLIIVLAASTIANFTIIGYQFALTVRLWRYIMLFFATLFGPLGIVCGLYLLLSLISTTTMLSKPFMSTSSPKAGIRPDEARYLDLRAVYCASIRPAHVYFPPERYPIPVFRPLVDGCTWMAAPGRLALAARRGIQGGKRGPAGLHIEVKKSTSAYLARGVDDKQYLRHSFDYSRPFAVTETIFFTEYAALGINGAAARLIHVYFVCRAQFVIASFLACRDFWTSARVD
ncbi:hypothetical protein DL346_16655 [Paenibacillus montanisoli]|uniref:Spore germination protein n=1 Tax=Paenibacillus montanisoli TaxID=2081970 RepID=A0A328U4T1_9BACL|nr:hypothetical protein DL346_16655 [Paenibacillus montanisoli]